MPSIDQTPAWQALKQKAQEVGKRHLCDMFREDAGRFATFSHEAAGLKLDLSKQHWDQQTLEDLLALADEAGMKLSHLALAWVLRNPNVCSAIVGASRPEQVTDNVQALQVTLEDDLVARVDEVLGDAVKDDPTLTVSPHRLRDFA